jgi:hypothetical protein
MLDRRHGITPEAIVANGLDFAGVALTGWCDDQATDVAPDPRD